MMSITIMFYHASESIILSICPLSSNTLDATVVSLISLNASAYLG